MEIPGCFKQSILAGLLLGLNCFVVAVPDNMATQAKVKASSMLSDRYTAANVVDDNMHVKEYGEWASKSKITFWGEIDFPWIELKWDGARAINKIILSPRISNASCRRQVSL